jgi:general stress protein 26
MDLNDLKQKAAALSPWAHIATVRPDGSPDVTPVHPCWEGDTLWIMVFNGSVKVRNVATNPKVALHWQVTATGDGVELWGTATVHTDLTTKERLWTGVFDYDLNLFAPDGPSSPQVAFMAVEPEKALYLAAYGMGGTERWSKS